MRPKRIHVTGGLSERLTMLQAVAAAWQARPPQFDAALAATVAQLGYEGAEVEEQLDRVVEPALVAGLAQIQEAGPYAHGPATILHLQAGTVPGLAIETLMHGLLVGAHNVVRPSGDDYSVRPFVELLASEAPQLAERVELVEDVPWDAIDGVILSGDDDTITAVTARLAPGTPVAAFGTRQGIAVITEQALATVDAWAPALASDITRFHQRGCMSPSRAFVVGEAAPLLRALRPLLPTGGATLEAQLIHRSAGDAAALNAIKERSQIQLVGGANGQLEVVEVQPDNLELHLAARGTTLQTAVLVCDDEERLPLTMLLGESGCTRVCAPGQAHFPPPDWPHEGVGYLAPLLVPHP